MVRPFSCISASNNSIAFQPCITAKSLSSRVICKCSPNASYNWLFNKFGSVNVTAGSRYIIPRTLKKSTSLVKAALITFGDPATTGQLVESITFCKYVGI
ncbi:hypothetical protein D3C73_921170 [compost metagenome]